MKLKTLVLSVGLVLGLAVASPVAKAVEIDFDYVTKTAGGSTESHVIFPANNLSSIRLVSLDVTNDTTGGLLKYFSGTASVRATNAGLTSSTNFYVLSGAASFVAGDVVVLQKSLTNDTACYTNSVYAVQGATNVILNGPFGVTWTTNDYLYRMGFVVTNRIDLTTTRKDGPAIFAGQRHMPIMLQTTNGTTVTRVNSATVHYDLVN